MRRIFLLFLCVCLTILLQAQVSKTVNVTPGGLSSALTDEEKSTITNLTLTGTIDARDFKTMRDDMSVLAVLDLSWVNIIAYTGTLGTVGTYSAVYNANTIPESAFYIPNTGKGKESLIAITLPSTVGSIGNYAFKKTVGLPNIAIPFSVFSIGLDVFDGFSGMINVDDNNPYYSSSDGVLFDKSKTILIKCPISKSGNYNLPSTVISIGNSAFLNCSNLSSVTLPSSVTTIGISAFSQSGLTSLSIPSSVTSIGSSAFYYCRSLTKVNIPSSVFTISAGAFTGSSGLFTVDLNNSNYSSLDGVLFNKAKTTLIQCPTSKNGNYPIPASVTSIGISAFEGAMGLKMIAIPASVISIGSSSFQSCYGLNSIFVYSSSPVSLASSSWVFSGISATNCRLYVPVGSISAYKAAVQWKDFTNIVEGGLWLSTNKVLLANEGSSNASVTITASVAWSASSDKSWLTVSPGTGTGNGTLGLTAEENPTYITRNATITVSATGLASQTITVTQTAKVINVTAGNLSNVLSDDELAGATNLKIVGTLDARDFVTMRDSMPNLAEIDLSEVDVLAYSGTKGTAGLTFTEYPANEMPQRSFNQSYTRSYLNWTSIILPESITSIGEYAIRGCYSLESIIIPPNVNTIKQAAFESCLSMTSIIIPSSVKIIEEHAFVRSSGLFLVDVNNQYYSNSSEGVLLNKDQTKLIMYPSRIKGSYLIPSSVDSIGDYAFAYNNLTTVLIPTTVKSIGEGAFTGSGIDDSSRKFTVNIPSSITTIERYTFFCCKNMNAIFIPSSVKNIKGCAFVDCSGFITVDPNNSNYSSENGVLFNKDKTTLIQCPTSKEGSYTIPSTVTSISSSEGCYGAFFSCAKLTSIIIPSSVLIIGQETFRSCRGLTSINIPSSVTSIGHWAFDGCINLATVNIPLLVTTIGGKAFNDCTALCSIYAYSVKPIDLSSSDKVFNNVNKTTCVLYVPFGSLNAYVGANQWKAFTNIQEMSGFSLSDTLVSIAATAGCTGSITIKSNTTWSASSDQTWLKVTPTTGANDNTLVFAVESNPTTTIRTATVIVSATGVVSQTITVTQDASMNISQLFVLNTGWNIISANLTPVNLALKDLFQPLIDAGKLKKVMDESGKTLENFGAFGGWKNSIGNWQPTEGYKVNVPAATVLTLEGQPIPLPFEIPLSTGWNIISYPATSSQDVKAAFQSLIDTGKLKKVMDESGKTLENFGAFGGWKNNIGSLTEGKGYKVNVTGSCTLTISEGGIKAATIVPEVLASTHFTPIYSGNGMDHMSINLVDLSVSGIELGDELGVFDGSICVGSAKVGVDQLTGDYLSIPVSASDGLTSVPNGFTEGHLLTVRYYREGKEYTPSLELLNDSKQLFAKGESIFLRMKSEQPTGIDPLTQSEKISVKCYPNPFSEQVTIEIELPKPGDLKVEVFDTSGRLIRTLYKGNANKNEHLLWDGRGQSGVRMPSGTYLLKVNDLFVKVILSK